MRLIIILHKVHTVLHEHFNGMKEHGQRQVHITFITFGIHAP